MLIRDPEKYDAIKSLVGSEISKTIDGTFHYHAGQTPPSEAEIDAELEKLKIQWDAEAYYRERSNAYPKIADQLDEIYHNGIDSWKALVKQTKDKYPKPE
tara:strand:- start:44 stop:343 length:300 start_codon:yes stop_codon:yes gene_type:complete